MVGLYCSVSGCTNNLAKCRSLGSNVTFHRFPIDPSLREIWKESCNRGEGWNKPNVFMCSDHFTPSDFRCSSTESGQKRTHLVRGAVPSRNLPTSTFVCCAVGCNDSPPDILVRRFPQDVKTRTKLLGDVPRKQGISLIDCYLCERHLVLKQFLKEEVEKIAKKKEEEAKNIVILEVSKIDGKHSTKLIEPQAKRRKVVFQLDDTKSVEEHEVQVSKTARNVLKRTNCDLNNDKTLKCEEISPIENELHQSSMICTEAGLVISSPISLASSNIGKDPLPVLVKNGETSQLMYLHHSAHIQSASFATSDLEKGLKSDIISNADEGGDDIVESVNRASSSTEPAVVKTTGNLLVDRLYRRIQELEEKIVMQRNRFKTKMTRIENKYSDKVKELNIRVKELKSEVISYNKLHKNIVNKRLDRPVSQSSRKLSPSISEEIQLILGHLFTSNQIKKVINEKETIRWSTSELLDAYTLKSLSYGAYTYVRNHLKYPLPSPKYVRRWLTKVEKEKEMNNTGIAVRSDQGSESENENDEDVDTPVSETETFKSKTSSGKIIMEHQSGLDDERENVGNEAKMVEDDLLDSEEILIVANPDDDSSSNIEISNQNPPENDFEAFFALDSSKESFQSPKVYVLKRRKEKLPGGDQIEDVSCSENLSECVLNEQSDNNESDTFEQVVIVEEVNEDNSHGGES